MSDFAERMQRIAAGLRTKTDEAVRQYVLTLHRTLVLETPILTGQAKANWQIDIGDTNDDYIGRNGFGTALARKGQFVDFASYSSEAQAKIPMYNTGQTIYIYNNLPYIQRLDDGFSDQAPAGFVESAITAARSRLQGLQIIGGV